MGKNAWESYENFKNGEAVDIAWERSQKKGTSYYMELDAVLQEWLKAHNM